MKEPTRQKVSTVGEARSIPVSQLRLDPDNPRMVSSKDGDSQYELAVTIEHAHDSLLVAESIATMGYFANEPLIVVQVGKKSEWTVVEGNRRLTALLGLTDKKLRDEFFEAEKWHKLAATVEMTSKSLIPCIQVADRRQVNAIVGFRHISGIAAWSPYAQASFIANLVDSEGLTFNEVSTMVGKKRTEVAKLYRNFEIAQQAKTSGEVSNALEGTFSLLTVAMSSPALRNHIGAPSTSEIEPGVAPIPDEKVGELHEVLGWIFGSEKKSAIVTDSRQIGGLGRVLQNATGLAALRSGASIEAAQSAIQAKGLPAKDKIKNHLKAGASAVRMAKAEFEKENAISKELATLLDSLLAEVADLEKVVKKLNK
jgi:hypothetical protein